MHFCAQHAQSTLALFRKKRSCIIMWCSDVFRTFGVKTEKFHQTFSQLCSSGCSLKKMSCKKFVKLHYFHPKPRKTTEHLTNLHIFFLRRLMHTAHTSLIRAQSNAHCRRTHFKNKRYAKIE